jgi:hypothetical protein
MLTVGARFDGQDIVAAKTLPVATDAWTADYASVAIGGCAAAPHAPTGAPRSRNVTVAAAGFALLVARRLRGRRR